MQRGIRDFFKGRPHARPPSPCTPSVDPPGGSGAPVEKAQPQAVKPVMQQFSRKRRRAEEPGSGPPPSGQSSPPLCDSKQPGKPDAPALPSSGQKKQGSSKQLTQMHLDMGQRDFHVGKCSVCGLVYSKGEESDEKIHAAYHTSATKGLRYQPWPNEKVVLVDGSSGRVVQVSCGGTRPKKVQEVCCFLEEQMGLVKGWLLAAPITLFLYVSPAKRILGCVAAEGIKEAFHVVPHIGAALLSQLRSHGSAAQEASSQAHQGSSLAGAAGGAANAAIPPTTQPAASITFSSRSACTAAAAAPRPSEAAIAEAQQACSPQPALGAVGLAQAAVAAEDGDDERNADSSPALVASLSEAPSERALPPASPQHGQQQQQEKQQEEEGSMGCLQDGHGGGREQRDSAGSPMHPLREEGGAWVGLSAQQAASQQQQQHNGVPRRATYAAQMALQPGADSAAARATVTVDCTQRVRAVCGVRVVWVSVEARRRGVATRLLDCARSQFMHGYVVPRHELAFTQPSDLGRALIQAYTSTCRFLVY